MSLLSRAALIYCILGAEDIAVEETTFGLSFNSVGLLLIGPTGALSCGLSIRDTGTPTESKLF